MLCDHASLLRVDYQRNSLTAASRYAGQSATGAPSSRQCWVRQRCRRPSRPITASVTRSKRSRAG